MYTVLRAYLKGISCMQKYPEYALDMRARAKMTGRLLMAFIPYAMAGKKPEAEHILLSMKGRVVALDNKGVRCVDEATVFQFAEEIYRFWDAHRGHSDGKLALLAEEMDHYLDGDSRAIQRAKRRLANKP
jgi:hypothetical protein